MDIDRDKAIKLIIVAIATIAALAVMSTMVQLIQAVLPFVIVAGGVYVGYRWALSDSAAPTADEVEEQARGLFSRFRKTRNAVETTMKVGSMLNNLQGKSKVEAKKDEAVVQGQAVKKEAQAEPVAEAEPVTEADKAVEEADAADEQVDAINKMKQSIESDPEGDIEFKDRDVVISKDDFVQPDTSRLEEKERETPKVTDNVLAQIEERRRRLQEGRDS